MLTRSSQKNKNNVSTKKQRSIVVGYVYLIQHDILTTDKKRRQYFKVGRKEDVIDEESRPSKYNRLAHYPGSSKLIECVETLSDCRHTESKIKKLFNKHFKNVPNLGNETFQGDGNKMRMMFRDVVSREIKNALKN